jgi:hypothetical protein
VWVDAGPGSLAELLRVRQLVVTHVGPLLTPEAATAQATFAGPTALAEVGATYTF